MVDVLGGGGDLDRCRVGRWVDIHLVCMGDFEIRDAGRDLSRVRGVWSSYDRLPFYSMFKFGVLLYLSLPQTEVSTP